MTPAPAASPPAALPPAALPPATAALGYAGLLPFALLVAGLWVAGAPDVQSLLLRGLLAYGATILTFLGAVHWGIVCARAGGPGGRGGGDARVLAAGVVPSVVAAVSLVLPPEPALVTQLVGFAATWLYEHRVLGERFLGKPYLDLRRTLTFAVVAMLLAALLGPVARLSGA